MFESISKTAKWAWGKVTATKQSIVVSAATVTTLVAGLYQKPVMMKLMGLMSPSNRVDCAELNYAPNREVNDYALTLNFRQHAIKQFTLISLTVWAAAMLALYYFNKKRAAAVKKLKNAAALKDGKGIKGLQSNADSAWLPGEVKELLDIVNKPGLAEAEKFAVLSKYIQSEYPAEVLEAIFAEDETLVKVKDEHENTLLHTAAGKGSAELVKVFTDRNVNPFLENDKGVKARSLAYDADASVATILLAYERARKDDIEQQRMTKELEAGQRNSSVVVPMSGSGDVKRDGGAIIRPLAQTSAGASGGRVVATV